MLSVKNNGGGSSRINGIKRTFLVDYDKDVQKGDFVKITESKKSGSLTYTIAGEHCYGIARLNGNKAIVAYALTGCISCEIHYMDKMIERKGTAVNVLLFESNNSCSSLDVVAISESKAIVFACADSALKAAVVDIDGTVVTVASTVTLLGHYASPITAKALTKNRFLLLYNGNSFYKSALVVTLAGNTLSAGTECVFGHSEKYSTRQELVRITDDCGFALTEKATYDYDNTYIGAFFNISGNAITVTKKSISGIPSQLHGDIYVKEFDDFFIPCSAYSNERLLLCRINRAIKEVSVVSSVPFKGEYFLGLEVAENGFGCMLTTENNSANESEVTATRILAEPDKLQIVTSFSVGNSLYLISPRSVLFEDGTALFYRARSVYMGCGDDALNLFRVEKTTDMKAIGVASGGGANTKQIAVTTPV